MAIISFLIVSTNHHCSLTHFCASIFKMNQVTQPYCYIQRSPLNLVGPSESAFPDLILSCATSIFLPSSFPCIATHPFYYPYFRHDHKLNILYLKHSTFSTIKHNNLFPSYKAALNFVGILYIKINITVPGR